MTTLQAMPSDLWHDFILCDAERPKRDFLPVTARPLALHRFGRLLAKTVPQSRHPVDGQSSVHPAASVHDLPSASAMTSIAPQLAATPDPARSDRRPPSLAEWATARIRR